MAFADAFLSRTPRAVAPEPSRGLKAHGGRTLLPTHRVGRPYQDGWDTERGVKFGMERVTWVFRCVESIADDAARLRVVLRRDDRFQGPVLESHPLTQLFNQAPNDDESAYLFRHRLSSQLLLSKRGAFIEVRRNNFGEIHDMHLLPVNHTRPIPGKGRFLDGFEVSVPSAPKRRLRPDQVIWVRNPHPTRPYEGLTPLEPIGLAADADWWARVYNRNFLQNDGRPGGIIVVKGEVDPDDADELVARFGGQPGRGPQGAGRISWLESVLIDPVTGEKLPGGGADFIDTATTPRDASYIDMRKMGKEEILAGFGCPESVVNANAAQRTFENAQAEETIYWRKTMMGHLTLVGSSFDHMDESPDVFLGFDLSSVNILERDDAKRKEHFLREFETGVITFNEYRELVGRDPYEVGGDVVRRDIKNVPVAGAAETSTPVPVTRQPLPSGAVIDPDPAGEIDQGDDDDPEPEPEPAPSGQASAEVEFGGVRVSKAYLVNVKQFRKAHIMSWERHTTHMLTSFFRRQEQVTLAKLRAAKTLRGTRHWVGVGDRPTGRHGGGHAGVGDRKIDTTEIFDTGVWDNQIVELADVLYDSIGSDAGTEALVAVNGEGPLDDPTLFDTAHPLFSTYTVEASTRIQSVNTTTREQLDAVLVDAEREGVDLDTIRERVTDVFTQAKTTRTAAIATTLVVATFNAAAFAAYDLAGVESKAWLAITDNRTRPSHSEADGQVVGLHEPFIVGGVAMNHPGDPQAPIDEVAGCRCSMVAVIGGVLLA